MHLKMIIRFRGFATFLAGHQMLSIIRGKKITLICQMFLIFILLNWINICYAAHLPEKNFLFNKFIKQISNHNICGIEYNPNKRTLSVQLLLRIIVL